jgi:spermidine synthase
MTLIELAELVQQMRNAQKEYFRTRSGSALDNAKRLEKRVDEALGTVLSQQPGLFD